MMTLNCPLARPRTMGRGLKRLVLTFCTVVAVGLAGCGSQKPIARVGGQSIGAPEFLDAVIKTGVGTSVLTVLIARKVVDEEAQRQGVVPSDDAVQKAIATYVKGNPQASAEINKDRADAVETIRFQLEVQNLLKSGVDLTSAKKKAWFTANHQLFDQPATVSIAMMVFDTMSQASQAEGILAKGGSPQDVAKSLGASSFPQNGQTQPPASQDQLTQMYGPSMADSVQALFAASARVGTRTAPIDNIFGMKKVGILQIMAQHPAKPSSYEANADKVELYMAVQHSAKKDMKNMLPDNATAQQYNFAAQQASQNVLRELMAQYFKDNKIQITDKQMDDTIKQQFTQAPQAPQAPSPQPVAPVHKGAISPTLHHLPGPPPSMKNPQ